MFLGIKGEAFKLWKRRRVGSVARDEEHGGRKRAQLRAMKNVIKAWFSKNQLYNKKKT